MALVLNDRVKETSVTTGTGTLTLDGAVQGFETFSSAIGNSNTTFYAIELPGTTEFEVGRGTISAGQLARTEIISSSNSDSAVDFSAGTKIVFCTLPASKFVPGKFEGANFADSILIGHSDSGTLSSAEDNTGVGIVALDALTSGDQNTAVGNEAGSGITSSGKNTGVGAFALNVVTDSTGFNSAFGRSALQLVTGSYNTGIGAGAGENITSGDGNVIIGKVLADSATADRQLKISGHDGSTTTTWISGDNTGALTFADKVVLAANKTIEFGDSGETISGDGTDLTITSSNDLDLVSNGTGTQSTLITSAGGIYLDSAETNRIDAATGILNFYKAGTLGISLNIDGNNDTVLHSRHNDKDIKFDGQDNNSTITALTLDMSAAGAATFNDKIILGANKAIEFGDAGESISGDGTDMTITGNIVKIDAASRIILDAAENRIDLHDNGTEFARFVNNAGQLQIRTGSSSAAAISFDSSGGATFNDKVILGANKVIEFGDSGETISGDGTAITVASSEDITLDAASEINLDAGSDSIRFKDDGTEYGRIHRVSGGGLIIKSQESDKDIQFQGVDGGSGITPMMIDMSEGGRVGIFGSGTTVPTAQLHVATDAGGVKLQVTGSSSSVTPGNDADEIFVDNAGNSGVTIGSGTSSKGSIHFGDSGDNDIGMIEYDHSSNSLAFTTDAAERIRVDSSGRVGIGTNSPSRDLHLKKSTSGSPVRFEVNNTSNTGSSHGVISIYSGGASGGDPYLHFKIDSGEQYSIGIDNDQSDALVFSNNFGVGSNNLLSIATDGSATFTGTVTADSGKDVILGKNGGTNFTNSLLVGHNTTGTLNNAQNNTGVGDVTLDALTSGDGNTAVGRAAGSNISSSSDQTVIGKSAGGNLSTGDGGNVAIGSDSIFYNTTGVRNVGVGTSALQGASGQSPDYSVGVGYQSLLNITTGDYNLALGTQAGKNITSGKGNVIIGTVDAASATGDRQLKISGYDGSSTTNWISGDSSGNITVSGTVTANGEVLTAGVSAGFAVAMAIAL